MNVYYENLKFYELMVDIQKLNIKSLDKGFEEQETLKVINKFNKIAVNEENDYNLRMATVELLNNVLNKNPEILTKEFYREAIKNNNYVEDWGMSKSSEYNKINEARYLNKINIFSSSNEDLTKKLNKLNIQKQENNNHNSFKM